MEAKSNMASRKRGCVSEGVLLALSPVIAYAFVYAFEIGYASHFGYPKSFVRVDLRLALGFWAGLVTLIVTMAAMFMVLAKTFPKRSTTVLISALIFPVSASILAGLLIWTLLTQELDAFSVVWYSITSGLVLLVVLLMSYIRIVQPLIAHEGSFIDRLKAGNDDYQEQLDEWPQGLVKDSIWEKMDYNWQTLMSTVILGGAVIGMIFGMVSGVGSWRASRQIEFAVSDDGSELVALRIYDDHIVAAELFEESKRIDSVFFVVPVDDARGWTLRRVGPLRSE